MKLALAIIILCITYVLGGCAAIKPFPSVARAGDTVILAAGSLEGATKDNITITYTPKTVSGAQTHPIDAPIDITSNIRSIFNLYPDSTSKTAIGVSGIYRVMGASGRPPSLTTVIIDLPADLDAGTGVIKVIPGPDVSPTPFIKEVKDIDIGMEIIPGTGSANDFEYFAGSSSTEPVIGDLTQLEAVSQVIVRPVDDESGLPYQLRSPLSIIYGAEITLDIPSFYKGTTDEAFIYNAYNIHMPNNHLQTDKQVQLSWTNTDFRKLTVRFISSYGYSAYFLRFSVTYVAPNLYTHYEIGEEPTVLSVKYFDENGNEMPGPPLEAVRVY